MTELTKYLIATVFLFFFLGTLAILSELIPMLIDRALPL